MKNQYNTKRSIKGFTLMEVMIVVGILGIVASIAFPSYMDYVRKGKRADAKVELLRLAQMQESYFVQNLSYASTLAQLGLAGTVKSEQEEYTMSISTKVPGACDGTSVTPCTGYTLTADATGSQANDGKCEDFTLSNTGVKGVTGAHSATPKDCW